MLYMTRGRAIRLLFQVARVFSAYRFAAKLLVSSVKEVGQDGELIPKSKSNKGDKKRILFLNRLHYIDFVRQLAKQSDFTYLDISWEALGQLRLAFVPDPTAQEVVDANLPVPGSRHVFQSSKSGTRIHQDREDYREFLKKTLPYVFEKLNVSCVLNSDARFSREVDFARVSNELGVPHFCVTRESMFLTVGLRDRVIKRHRYFDKFSGSRLFAQNEATREVFTEAGYARDDQISVIGSVRSVALIEAINSGKHKVDQDSKSVVMFTWPPKCYGPNGYRLDLSNATKTAIEAVCHAAIARPDVTFKIKPKHNHASPQLLEPIRAIIRSYGDRLTGNVILLDKTAEVLELMLNASVVVAMQSTTVLEASIAEKPVIMPHFSELRSDDGYLDAMLYAQERHLFDVPDSREELTSLILHRLDDPIVPPDILSRRKNMFIQHVCPLDHNVMSKFISEVKSFI